MTTTADMLRSAAAWLRLAADKLDAGDEAKARDYAEIGRWGVQSQRVTSFIESRPKPTGTEPSHG